MVVPERDAPGNIAATNWPSPTATATIQVTFATSGRPKTITFQISYPDSCNLKDKPEHLKIKECLKRWGIARE